MVFFAILHLEKQSKILHGHASSQFEWGPSFAAFPCSRIGAIRKRGQLHATTRAEDDDLNCDIRNIDNRASSVNARGKISALPLVGRSVILSEAICYQRWMGFMETANASL
jgi:hypothetical protein